MAEETFQSLSEQVIEYRKTIQKQQQTIIKLKQQIKESSNPSTHSVFYSNTTLQQQEATIQRLQTEAMSHNYTINNQSNEIKNLNKSLESIPTQKQLLNQYLNIIQSLTTILKNHQIPSIIPKIPIPHRRQ